jgi:hypothetical protein
MLPPFNHVRLWIDIAIVVLCLMFAAIVHGQDYITRDEHNREIDAVNAHLRYTDDRLNNVISDVDRLQVYGQLAGYLIGGLATSSIIIQIRRDKK